MTKCDFISDYQNYEVVNTDDLKEFTPEEEYEYLQKQIEALYDFVINYVVADGNKRRSEHDLNGYSRWKLANIFLEATDSEFGFLSVDVDSIATDIDDLIPLAFNGFHKNKKYRHLNFEKDISDTNLVYRYYDNSLFGGIDIAKHFKPNNNEVDIPESIKRYKYTPMAKEVTPMP